jgi:hypothetical protein
MFAKGHVIIDRTIKKITEEDFVWNRLWGGKSFVTLVQITDSSWNVSTNTRYYCNIFPLLLEHVMKHAEKHTMAQ